MSKYIGKVEGLLEYKLFLDTNALLNLQEAAFKESFIISQKTLEEIEKIKNDSRKDGEIKYKARQIAHLLDKKYGEYEVVKYNSEIKKTIEIFNLEETPDNIILASALEYNDNFSPIIVCTDDLNCKFISKNIFGLETKGVNELNLVKNLDEYKGYKEVTLSDEEMSYFYLHTNENIYNCEVNEYLIIKKSDGEIVDYRKWDGMEHKAISYKQINSHFLGKIKPRNPQQVLAFDMLQNNSITLKVLSGGFGSGKSMLMIANALKLIEEGKYERLVFVRNPITVKNITEIGFLPGELESKLKPGAMVLADHLGGETGLDMQIMAGNISIEYIGNIRGRDYKNCIIYCTEAENLSKEHVQLLIGRVSEGSSLWLDGDYKQVDSPLFRMNNGLLSAVQKLAGHEKFGYVQLQKTERSETAAMADLLD